MYKVHRHHDISAGHRVAGHENKCRHLHGHNYRVHFTCVADELDKVGRVIDFGVVKEKLCMWLEDNWDHKFLHWEQDPMFRALRNATKSNEYQKSYEPEPGCSINPTPRQIKYVEERHTDNFLQSLVSLPFNPTAENMAQHLVEVVGPAQLAGTGVKLVEVRIEETAKCYATYEVEK